MRRKIGSLAGIRPDDGQATSELRGLATISGLSSLREVSYRPDSCSTRWVASRTCCKCGLDPLAEPIAGKKLLATSPLWWRDRDEVRTDPTRIGYFASDAVAREHEVTLRLVVRGVDDGILNDYVCHRRIEALESHGIDHS